MRVHGLVAVVIFTALTLVVSLQVLNRFVLQMPMIWSEEVARFLFLWVVMLGAAMSVRRRRHFVLDVTMGRRPKGRLARILFEAIPDACMLAFGIFLLFQGFSYASTGMLRTATNSGINMVIVYAAIPLFALLTVVYAARNLIEDIRARAEQPKLPPAAE